MKNWLLSAMGIVGGVISGLFGGWSASITTLLIFMAIDYIMGIVVAGVFHKSPKTATGTLESRAGLKGLFRKLTMLLFVLIGYRLDIVAGVNFIRDGVCIAFIVNEGISLIENAGLMGVPIPAVIKKAIDILHDKTEEENNGKD